MASVVGSTAALQLRPSLRVGAVQPMLRAGSTHPVAAADEALALIKACAADRLAAGEPPIDLFVLPELAPVGYSEHTFATYLDDEATRHEVGERLAAAARELDAFIAYGEIGTDEGGGEGAADQTHTASSSSSSEAEATATATATAAATAAAKTNKTIRHVVLDASGERVSTYDKMSLCDYGVCSETRFFRAGRGARSFDCRGFRVGMLICADMRNPHLASRLMDQDHAVDLIIQPSAFARDQSFRTWRSFRETRAVESGVYWLGVNYAGDEFGESSFVEPWVDEGHEPLVLGSDAAVLVGEVRRDVLDRVRTEMPFRAWALAGRDVLGHGAPRPPSGDPTDYSLDGVPLSKV